METEPADRRATLLALGELSSSTAPDVLANALNTISDILERAEDAYQTVVVDPHADERRGHAIGQLSDLIMDRDNVVESLVTNFVFHRESAVTTAAMRLLLVLAPLMHPEILLQDERMVDRLLGHFNSNEQPIRTYATGVLAVALGERDVADRVVGTDFVTVALSRLRAYLYRTRGIVIPTLSPGADAALTDDLGIVLPPGDDVASQQQGAQSGPISTAPNGGPGRSNQPAAPGGVLAPEVLGGVVVGTLRDVRRRFDRRYGEPLFLMQCMGEVGEYQESLAAVFEGGGMEIALHFLAIGHSNRFFLLDALKCLCGLLAHRKFASEFVDRGGVGLLLAIPRLQYVAGGVALALYSLSCVPTVMEKVCLLPHPTTRKIVAFALWLVECGHDSARMNAALFFHVAFSFRAILELFDEMDGLRLLINLISTQFAGAEETSVDARPLMTNTCLALRQYMRMHLESLADTAKRRRARRTNGDQRPIPPTPLPAYKAASLDTERANENMRTVLDSYFVLFPNANNVRSPRWRPTEQLIKLEAIPLLLQLVEASDMWRIPDLAQFALEVLEIAAVVPATHLPIITAAIEVDGPAGTVTGVALILAAAEGKPHQEPDVRRAALQLLCALVCRQPHGSQQQQPGPSSGPPRLSLGSRPTTTPGTAPGAPGPPAARRGANANGHAAGGARSSGGPMTADDVAWQVWESVRGNNGIRVLLQLLHTRSPPKAADAIRALACRALLGLSRNTNILQILSKLQVTGALSDLSREPVLPDGASWHEMFRSSAMELIASVTGRTGIAVTSEAADHTLRKIEKAAIVSTTNVSYPDRELLRLIHAHLQSKGLARAADALQAEAMLDGDAAAPLPTTTPLSQLHVHSHGHLLHQMSAPSGTGHVHSTPSTPWPTSGARGREHHAPSATAHVHRPGSPEPKAPKGASNLQVVPVAREAGAATAVPQSVLSTPVAGSGHATPVSATTPLRFRTPMSLRPVDDAASTVRSQTHASHAAGAGETPTVGVFAFGHTPAAKTTAQVGDVQGPKSLDQIVTQYLRDQHTHCPNPVAVLPPFSLLKPHRCPEPIRPLNAPLSVTARVHRAETLPPFGGTHGRRQMRRFIYSRFRPVRVYRDEFVGYTCVSFLGDDRLVLGTYTGEIKVYQLDTTAELMSVTCHSGTVYSARPSHDATLLLTSSSYGPVRSCLWSMDNMEAPRYSFADDAVVMFSNANDRIVGTAEDSTQVYSVATGQRLCTLSDPANANNYRKNCAFFNPTDDLILSDGILWDPRISRKIHKFDKFNNYYSGKFHPSGLEVVINSEIWDLRTFKLLRTVPALEQSQIVFNDGGDVIYGVVRQYEDEYHNRPRNPFSSTFRTFDATDYSSIATVDLERRIVDLCPSPCDTRIAVVENESVENGPVRFDTDVVACRLYEVGRKRPSDDDSDADDDTEEDMEDGDEEMDSVVESEDDSDVDAMEGLLAAASDYSSDAGDGDAAPAVPAGDDGDAEWESDDGVDANGGDVVEGDGDGAVEALEGFSDEDDDSDLVEELFGGHYRGAFITDSEGSDDSEAYMPFF